MKDKLKCEFCSQNYPNSIDGLIHKTLHEIINHGNKLEKEQIR